MARTAQNPFRTFFFRQWEFVTLFALFLFTRIMHLPRFLWYNESAWAAETTIYHAFPHAPQYIPHPPVGISIFKLCTLVFGETTWAVRLVPLLFGIATFCLLYWFAHKHFSRRVAALSLLAYTLSYYAFLATVQVDMDGNMITTFTFLALIAYVALLERPSWWRGALFGLSLTLLSMTRVVAGVIALIIVGLHFIVHSLMVSRRSSTAAAWRVFGSTQPVHGPVPRHDSRKHRRDERRSSTAAERVWGVVVDGFKRFWLPVATYVVTTGICFVLLWLALPESTLYILQYSAKAGAKSLTTLLLAGFAGLLLGPLLFLPLLFLKPILRVWKRQRSALLLLCSWILVFILIVFGMATAGDMPRYFMPAIPALCVLFGLFGDWLLEKKLLSLTTAGMTALVTLPILYVVNVLTPFNPPASSGELLARLAAFDWSFLFFLGGSSARPFYVQFLILVVPFVLALLFLVVFLLGDKRVRRISSSLIIGLLFACNLFLIAEMTTSATQPDVHVVASQMFGMLEHDQRVAGKDLIVDANSFDPSTFYLGKTWDELHMLSPFNDFTRGYTGSLGDILAEKELVPVAQEQGLLILVFDYVGLGEERLQLHVEQPCREIAAFSDKGVTIGHVYACY